MDVLENLKRTFKQGDANIRLIYINAAVFLLVNLLNLSFRLFLKDGSFLLTYLGAPADLSVLILKPWTLFTYMFVHEQIWHFFFNMLTLFWFGKIFLMYFSEKQLVGLYVIGGLLGVVFYVIAFNAFPLFHTVLPFSRLIGASASIMAIVVACAFRAPNMEMQMLLIDRVKLKFIALFFVVISLFDVVGDNGGGALAHLGGALAGYLFVVSLRKGREITKPVTAVLNWITTLFAPRKLKVKPNPYKRQQPMSDGDYNANKARRMAEIDKILDKIKTSGYDSLSAEEKRQLFEQSNKN